MPAYGTTPPRALYKGDLITVSSASIPGLKTQAWTMTPEPGASSAQCTVSNGSAQVATVQYAAVDADANYQALSDEATAITVAAGASVTFRGGTGFYRLLMAGDPGATTITVAR